MGIRVDGEPARPSCWPPSPSLLHHPALHGLRAAVLVRLDDVEEPLLAELVEDAWRVMAPAKLQAG